MWPYQFLITLLVFTFAATEGYGQMLPFRSYSIEHGLSESVARAMVQDDKGYVWVGTGYGLNRFDARRFTQYYEEDGLSSNRIFSLFHDAEGGLLWIGTELGITVLDQDTFYTPAYLEPLNRFSVTAIFKDSRGEVWVGTDGNGLWKLDLSHQLISIDEKYELPIERIRAISEAADGSVWVGAREGLVRISDDVEYYAERFGAPEMRVRDFDFDSRGIVYIGTRTGLVRFDGTEFRIFDESDGLRDARILSVTTENDQRIWLGTESGISLFDGARFENFGREEGLPGSIVHSTMVGKEGNMWFGTFGGGIALLAGNYFRNYNIENGLPNNVVTGFLQDKHGDIWIATYGGGALRFDGSEFEYFDESNGLIDNKVYTFLESVSGEIWIGTSEGISIYENGTLKDYEDVPFPLRSVRKIYQDERSGELWIATYNDGIFRISEEGYQHYHTGNVLQHNTVMDIKEDLNGHLWFATYGGAVVYDGNSFTHYTIADGLQNNGIIHIHVDQNNEKWFSSFGGIAKYDGERIYRIAESESSETIVYFMLQDQNENYYAGTTLGFFRLDPDILLHSDNRMERLKAFRLYNRNQGLIANEVNTGGYLLAEDGTIWLGTVGGISRFFPDQVKMNSAPPVIEFEEVLMSGKSLKQGTSYTFRHDQNFLQVSFLGLNYEAPDQLFYEYRLKGLDEGWQLTRETGVRYPSLSAGQYEYQLRVYNADGIQSLNTATIQFTILAPFYMRWWFLALMVLLVAVVLTLAFRYLAATRQVDIERMRVQIASDLHDDIGSTLTELALQTDFLLAGEISGEMRETLQSLGDQSRKVVNSLDDIVWSIDSRNDTAGDVTDRMQDYVNQVLASRGVEVIYDFENLRSGEKLPVDIKENVYLIFKEAINNIAKHSRATKVNIIFAFSGKEFDLTIRDNGRQGDKNRKTGQGLRNMKMRARRIGAKLTLSTGSGFEVQIKGTTK